MDILEKANGRLEPADEREMASKAGKPFKCTKCKVIQRIENVEFGEQYYCAICNGLLHE